MFNIRLGGRVPVGRARSLQKQLVHDFVFRSVDVVQGHLKPRIEEVLREPSVLHRANGPQVTPDHVPRKKWHLTLLDGHHPLLEFYFVVVVRNTSTRVRVSLIFTKLMSEGRACDDHVNMNFCSNKHTRSERQSDLCIQVVTMLQSVPCELKREPLTKPLTTVFMDQIRTLALKNHTVDVVRAIVGSDLLQRGRVTEYSNVYYSAHDVRYLVAAIRYATSLRPDTPSLRAKAPNPGVSVVVI